MTPRQRLQAWFARQGWKPLAFQREVWRRYLAGESGLLHTPTGSGKTLAAFGGPLLEAMQEAQAPPEAGVPRRRARRPSPRTLKVLWITPLRALASDTLRALSEPCAALGLDWQIGLRTGDASARDKRLARDGRLDVLVTTPESLYVLMGSASGRESLRHVRTVIVDEIHALVAGKRGSHLALTLERLQALVAAPLVRVGLSATQKPIDAVARFLVGTANVRAGVPDCAIVDIGYARPRDLALGLPASPLIAVMSTDQWMQVYAEVARLAGAHRTTLVFVNTRRMAERATRHLGELLGKERVAAHHGSLARDARLLAERRLKAGELTVLVATASLELGLDIGDVDLVCQLGSPRSIATFLQRAGRSGHAVGGTPKARLFPSSRDELVECAALLDSVRRGEMDALRMPQAPIDVLAQQIVAEAACGDCEEDALYALVRRAWPYAQLPRERFDAVVRMLADGFSTRLGQRASYLHRDAVHRRLHARRGARMTALTSGGTIPETGDYTVVLEPQSENIGTVNEDFAVESLAGDVFQLGNASYRILRVEQGRMRVEDARGAPPNIPFWIGEAPGRSDELSASVSRLRTDVAAKLREGGEAAARAWLVQALGQIGRASC
ncbi:MAG TPA: ATP-dependent DNA helicase, partial [Xanthomonadaceae bacterium]|nr:ATP-dependent DNA helicase [Xanthomonadaceae bacterium]